jgi:hypothetical protein
MQYGDEFSTRYNKRHTSSESGVSAGSGDYADLDVPHCGEVTVKLWVDSGLAKGTMPVWSRPLSKRRESVRAPAA